MRVRMAVVGVAGALTIGLAACAGGQDVVRSDAAGTGAGRSNVLQAATAKTVAAEQAKVSITVSASGLPSLAGPSGSSGSSGSSASSSSATVSVEGAIDTAAHRSQFTVDLSQIEGLVPGPISSALGSLHDGKLDVVTDGSDVYIDLGSLGGIFGATSGTSWVKVSGPAGAGADAGGYLADGTDILQLLGNAGQVTTVGTEAVRGVDTTHYRGTVDVASALAQLPADKRAEVQSRLAQLGVDPASVSFPVDVWVDKDDLVRRVQLAVDSSKVVKTAGAPAITGTVTMELYDVGQPVTITVPPANQVFTVDPSMLQGLGALVGGGAPTGHH
jgi:hypothetical protein